MTRALSTVFICLSLTACGSSGELGLAKFNIEGDLHEAQVAVGSAFSASAKVSTFGEKLNIRSDDSGLIQPLGDKFQVVDAGEFRVEAWRGQKELVDWIYFSAVQPADIMLRSGTAHNFKWSASTENSFAMLAGDSVELAMDLVDAEGNPLLHANLLHLDMPASWQLQADLKDDAISLYAGYSGSTDFTIHAGEELASTFYVDVVEDWELQSLQISTTPPMASPTFEHTDYHSGFGSGSWFLVSAYGQTWDGKAVLLGHEHFSVSAESVADEIIVGAGGLWINVPFGEYATVNVSAGPLSSSYIIGAL